MLLTFELDPPRPRDALRPLFEAMATTLEGRAVSLQRLEHRPEEDRNGLDYCYFAKWADGPVTYEEHLSHSSGNPRDGWGYSLELKLTLPKLTITAGGSEANFTSFSVRFESSARDWLALRETLRRELGASSDRSHAPWVVHEVLPTFAAQGALSDALALAKESLAHSAPNELRRDELVAWLAVNAPSSAGPAMRVREAPGALEGWLELERAGDSTLSEAFARLCPYELTRWQAAALPPAPWFAHPSWPLERDASAPAGEWWTIHLTADHVWPSFVNSVSRALTGWGVMVDWYDVRGDVREGAGGWRWRSARRARVPDQAKLPVVHVTLEGVRREPGEWELSWDELEARKPQETLTWSWLGGPDTGDALLIVERALPKRRHASPESAAITFTAVGSSEFRARAEAVVIQESGLRWYPVPVAQSLEPWTPPAERFPDVRAALEAIVSPERFARALELLTCRCVQPAVGYCEHRVELLGYEREDFRRETPAASARWFVWNAAFYSVGAQPDLEAMNRYLADAYRAHLQAAERAG